jgi:hypothetical protein
VLFFFPLQRRQVWKRKKLLYNYTSEVKVPTQKIIRSDRNGPCYDCDVGLLSTPLQTNHIGFGQHVAIPIVLNKREAG